MAIDLKQFRIVKHVTRPLLKLVDGVPTYIKLDAAFKQAEQQKNPKKDAAGNIIPPPFVIDITNLEGGIPSTMVANEVFRSELEKQYPNETYVGKYFEIIKNTKAEGKNYNTFGITELAPVEEEKPVSEVKTAVQATQKTK